MKATQKDGSVWPEALPLDNGTVLELGKGVGNDLLLSKKEALMKKDDDSHARSSPDLMEMELLRFGPIKGKGGPCRKMGEGV